MILEIHPCVFCRTGVHFGGAQESEAMKDGTCARCYLIGCFAPPEKWKAGFLAEFTSPD